MHSGKKGQTDIAIGNIVGSNIFNILFVAGTTMLITPVQFEQNFLLDGIMAIVVLFSSGCAASERRSSPGRAE